MRASLYLVLGMVFLLGCHAPKEGTVTLYSSQDQFYAEPILREFEQKTGIEVRPVFDTESAKTAGLANRLRQEADHPLCDVFWSNEEMHARILAAEGVFPASHVLTAGYRTRRLVVNTNLVALASAPRALLDLTNAAWKGKIALAYPLYGTTASHFLALRQKLGDALWRRWCEGLVANGAKVVDGNSVVVRLVGAGEAWLGLTDSDDVAAGKRSGLPVETMPLTPEMLVIPNTISLVSPATPAAERLIEFLAQPDTLRKLVELGALEGVAAPALDGLRIDWKTAPADLAEMNAELKEIFLRS